MPTKDWFRKEALDEIDQYWKFAADPSQQIIVE
jgi:hypothetical protein